MSFIIDYLFGWQSKIHGFGYSVLALFTLHRIEYFIESFLRLCCHASALHLVNDERLEAAYDVIDILIAKCLRLFDNFG